MMLQSSDPAARLISGDTLKLVTGRDFGFKASASPPVRFEAAARWRTWVDTLPDETRTTEVTARRGTSP